jgi:capsular exopolysaccharide synthesis family protein
MAEEKNKLMRLDPYSDAAIAATEHFPLGTYTESYGYGLGEPPLSGVQQQLSEIWRKIRKHKWLILFIVLIITSIVTVEIFRTKSLYQASTTVEIEKENRTLFRSGDVVIESEEGDFGYYVAMSMKTKVKLLQSRPLLEDVVAIMKLDQNPSFMEVDRRKSVWEAVRTILTRVGTRENPPAIQVAEPVPIPPLDNRPPRSATESARLAPYVGILAGNLSAAPIEETRMLAISYQHTNPALAASIVNTIAQVFIERSFINRTQKYNTTSSWLKDRTRELQAKVQEAEQRLANYANQRNMFSTDGKESMITGKLAKMHEQVTRAETDRILKQSLYEEVQQGRVAQLPEAFADAKTAALQNKLGELSTTAAQYAGKFGPDNPRTIDINKQIAAIQKQIEEGRVNLSDKLKADFERAQRDEESLKVLLEQAKAEAAQQNNAVVQFGILKQEVETAKVLYTDFLQKTNQANIQVAEQHSNMQVIDPATVPVMPISPNRLRVIMIGLLFSLCFGVGLALLIEYLDNTVKTVEDVERSMGLPTLAVIPALATRKMRGLSGRRATDSTALTLTDENAARQGPQFELLNNSHSAFAEAYRGLRASVLLSSAGNPPKVIMVTSGMPSEGKTTTAVNTAISLAQLGASVLVIDADLRRPSVHKVFSLSAQSGLSTCLSRDMELDPLIHSTGVDNLSVLLCGPLPPNPAELISSNRMKEMLKTLKERYDHIVIDSPPLMQVSDSLILSTLVDGVIFVVEGGKSKRHIVQRARRELTQVGAKIFGVVINNVNVHSNSYDDYYYSRFNTDYYSSLEHNGKHESMNSAGHMPNEYGLGNDLAADAASIVSESTAADKLKAKTNGTTPHARRHSKRKRTRG